MKKTITIQNGDGTTTKVRVSEDASILTHRDKPEKILFGVVFVLFLLYSITLLLPFYYLIINSLKGSLEYINHSKTGDFLFFPMEMHFENYLSVFSELKIPNSVGEDIYLPTMIFNSLWTSFLSIFCGLFASAIVAYPLSKYRFKLRGFIYGICIVNMTIPIIGSTGSMFKLCIDIGIYNTPLYILLTSFGGFGFNFLILYGFFSNLSWTYAEAVFIDGGGHSTAFFKIMLPQAWPPIMTLAIMSFIGAWNDYMTTLLYMPDFPTLATGVYKLQSITRAGNYPKYFAALVISVVPVIALYAGFSDMIMKNFTVGGLKG